VTPKAASARFAIPKRVLVLIFFTATVVAQTTMTTGQQSEIDEAYSIYSLLITNELKHSPTVGYVTDLIAQNTVTKGWQVRAPEGRPPMGVRDCIHIPTNETQEYDSAISDFERKNSSSVVLEERFTLAKPYLLLSDSDVVSFRHTELFLGGFRKDYQPDHRFDGGSALISLSRVGFSEQGNIAVVYAEQNCGATCGSGALHVFKKQGDKWIEENAVTCAWDA
jgi:hypothetical protein